MEAVAAVGLATNVLQVIEVVRDITCTVKDIRKSASGFATETNRFRERANLIRDGIDTLIGKTSAKYLPNNELQGQLSTLRGEIDDFVAQLIMLHSKIPNALGKHGKLPSGYEQAKEIDELSNQVSVNLVMVHLPKMDVRLDDLCKQNARWSAQMSNDMTCLRQCLQRSRNSDQEHGLMLQSVKKWFAIQDEIAEDRGCLNALYLPEIQVREGGIKSAHQKTFQWVLDEAVDPASPTKSVLVGDVSNQRHKERTFLRYLRSKDDLKNVFCIFGKPGAGKSTLMKYLARQKALKTALKAWTGDRELIVAQHFFWLHGSLVQRPLTGQAMRRLCSPGCQDCFHGTHCGYQNFLRVLRFDATIPISHIDPD